MRKHLIIFFIFFLYSNTSYSEIANKLVVLGNERISSETIKVYGDVELNKDLSKNDIDQILKKLYGTDFFENVNINLNQGTLTIDVKEYQVINSIKFEGEKSDKLAKKILETLKLQEKNSFIKNYLQNDIIMIKKIYSSTGFNFTKVEAKIERFSANRVNLIFQIEKGNKTSISKIFFIGEKVLKDRRLRDIVVSEEDKFWKFLSKNTNLNNQNIALDKRLLKNYYKSLGYYDVQVLSSSAEINQDNETSLTFNINAGNRYRIKKIATNVSPVLDKNIFLSLNKEYKKVVGKYYSPFKVTKLLKELDALIAANDLQFIQHSVNEIIDPSGIELTINIFEGDKLSVERINIKGNSVTNESVIRSELNIDEGDPFNSLKLDQSVGKLKARNLFAKVSTKISEGSSKDLKIVDIIVEEKPTGEISAGAGVGTTGGSFQFAIKENNWLGRGLAVSSFLDISAESLRGSLQLSDPDYNFSGNQVTYHVSSEKNDKESSGYENSIFSTGVGTTFEQYRDIYISPSVNLTFDDMTVQSSASANLKKQAGSFTDLAFNYGLTSDKRNNRFMPTDGYVSSFSQEFPLYADSGYVRNSYKFSKYNSFGSNVIGAFKINVAAINSIGDQDIRLSKRLKVNSRSLRGFKAGQVGPKDGKDYVGGNYSTVANLETNLPNLFPDSTNIDLGLFLDVGNLWGVDYDSSVDESNNIRSSVGTNINWSSPMGPMSFILSQNIQKASTDVTETFNFRLGTTF
jgi:outer membrane protein insertion porin family